jgi:hypothetical protein
MISNFRIKRIKVYVDKFIFIIDPKLITFLERFPNSELKSWAMIRKKKEKNENSVIKNGVHK